MLATIHTMVVNKKIFRVNSIHHETHVRGVLWHPITYFCLST